MNFITFQDTPHPGLFVVFFCGILLHKTSHYIYHMGSKVLRREDQLSLKVDRLIEEREKMQMGNHIVFSLVSKFLLPH